MTVSLKLNNGASIGPGRLAINEAQPSKSEQEENTEQAQAAEEDTFVVQKSNEANVLQDLFDYASQAYAEVQYLRQKQQILAAKAEDSGSNEYRSDLSTELGNIETEIQRIKNTSQFNGRAIVPGGTYSVADENNDYHQAVTLPDAQALFVSTGVSITSQSSAQSAYYTLESFANATAQIKSSAIIGSNKLSDINNDLNRTINEDPLKILQEELAKQTAGIIADEIGAAGNRAQASGIRHELDLVHNLDSARVRDLLS